MCDDRESEKLFLLEFLVDTVHLPQNPNCPGNCDYGISIGQLCVTFQFLQYPAVEVTEQSSANKCPADKSPSFNCGKSCLFALPGKQLTSAPGTFTVDICVARKFPPGVLPDKIIIGQTAVDLTPDFTAIIADLLNSPQEIPVCKTLKDNYILQNNAGDKVIGTISLFIRLSCFGQLIVTQFQLSGEKSFLFSANEDLATYQCNKVDSSGQFFPDECPAAAAAAAAAAKESWSGMCSYGGGKRDYTECPALSFGGGEQACPCSGGSRSRGSSSKKQQQVCPASRPNKQYEEIGTEINGNFLTIRVPKSMKRKKCPAFEDAGMSDPQQGGSAGTDQKSGKCQYKCPGAKDSGGFLVEIPKIKPCCADSEASRPGVSYKVLQPCPNLDMASTVPSAATTCVKPTKSPPEVCTCKNGKRFTLPAKQEDSSSIMEISKQRGVKRDIELSKTNLDEKSKRRKTGSEKQDNSKQKGVKKSSETSKSKPNKGEKRKKSQNHEPPTTGSEAQNPPQSSPQTEKGETTGIPVTLPPNEDSPDTKESKVNEDKNREETETQNFPQSPASSVVIPKKEGDGTPTTLPSNTAELKQKRTPKDTTVSRTVINGRKPEPQQQVNQERQGVPSKGQKHRNSAEENIQRIPQSKKPSKRPSEKTPNQNNIKRIKFNQSSQDKKQKVQKTSDNHSAPSQSTTNRIPREYLDRAYKQCDTDPWVQYNRPVTSECFYRTPVNDSVNVQCEWFCCTRYGNKRVKCPHG